MGENVELLDDNTEPSTEVNTEILTEASTEVITSTVVEASTEVPTNTEVSTEVVVNSNNNDNNKNKNKKIGIIIIAVVLFIVFIFVFLFKVILPITSNGLSTNNKYNGFKVVSVDKSSSGNYIGTDEEFIIKTKKGTLEEVKKHILVEPAINYDIEATARNTYKLVTKDVPSDTLLNISYVDNTFVEDKWAFQSTKDLKVNSIYPANETSNIPTTSTIQIVFSYPDVEDITNSVEITPKVEGTFEHYGRVWIFKPKTPLAEDTKYTVLVKDTVKRGDTHLLEAYKSTFSTYKTVSNDTKILNYSSITFDNIATFTPSDDVYFRTTKDIKRVEILKLKDANEFRKYINNSNDCKVDSLGDYPFEVVSNGLYKLGKKLEAGYYLEKAYLETGELSFTIPVQVNDLSVYMLSTQNDLLFWTSSNNKLLENVSIKYEDKTVKTNKDGIATIKDYNDLKGKIKFVEASNGADPVFIGVNNVDRLNYPNGYIYTDRPLYKNTDTIRIFGYVPLKYFENKDVSVKDFLLEIDNENIPVDVLNDGTFITNFGLNNYKDGYKHIYLKYKNKTIAYRGVEVKQYEKDMYEYIINVDKNYVKAGNKYHFTVGVKHLSGVMVPNKEVQATYNNKTYNSVTNDDGIASFDIETVSSGDNTTIVSGTTIKVTGTLTESIQEGYNIPLYVINKYVGVKDNDYKEKNKEYSVDIYNLSDSKNVEKISYNYDQLYDSKYSGKVKVELVEHVSTKTIVGYTYNEITKENTPKYNYNSYENVVESNNIDVSNGNLKYNINYKYKKKTDNNSYVYYLNIYVKDKHNSEAKFSYYIRDNSMYSSDIYGYYTGEYSSSIDYGLYNYYLKTEKDDKKFSVGEKFNKELYYFNGDLENTDNKFLLIKYKNNHISNNIFDKTSSISSSFDDSDRPGFKITGSYYKDGRFYRLPTEYLDYNEEDSKLDVSINTNKKKYTPGDEVEAEINVLKNNKGKKVKLNISVVDEGVFNVSDDNTDILGRIYSNLSYYNYTYSTYRDYNLHIDGGGSGSSTGGVRTNFGDTIYFDMVETDNNGKAKIKFKLNDSVTSFRITVHAVDDDASVGVNHVNVESSIPIAISSTEPRGLKVDDEVVLNALSIGSSKQDINYVFKINEINKEVKKSGQVGKTVYASFGKLKVGEYTVNITASSKDYTDKIEYKIHVGNTQTEVSLKNTDNINKLKNIKPVKNPIKLEFYRESFKDYEKYLDIIKTTNENRLDIKFSYMKALEYENNYVEDKNNVEIGDISSFKVENGWKYLPGEEISYELTALLSYYDKSFRYNKDIYYNMLRSDDIKTRLNGYMVLASMKEAVLDDLYNLKVSNSEQMEKLVLSYLFLGDYNKVRELKDKIANNSLNTYLSTFVDKDNAVKNIDKIYKNSIADRYVYFSIVSFFENNNVDLEKEEKLYVNYGKEKKELVIKSLGKTYLNVYQDDLKDIKFNSNDSDIMVNYYYEGTINEISGKADKFNISLDKKNIKLGENVNLNIDVSNIKGNTFKVYLPNGLRVSNNKASNNYYIDSSKIEYVVVSLYDNSPNNIIIPLYATSPGEYKMENIVVKKDDKYYISNDLKIKIEEK